MPLIIGVGPRHGVHEIVVPRCVKSIQTVCVPLPLIGVRMSIALMR